MRGRHPAPATCIQEGKVALGGDPLCEGARPTVDVNIISTPELISKETGNVNQRRSCRGSQKDFASAPLALDKDGRGGWFVAGAKYPVVFFIRELPKQLEMRPSIRRYVQSPGLPMAFPRRARMIHDG